MYDNDCVEPTTSWREHIISTPGVVGGKPAIRGTRLTIEFLLGLFSAGWTQEQVLEEYESLTPQSLRAVFAFAAEVLHDEMFVPLTSAS